MTRIFKHRWGLVCLLGLILSLSLVACGQDVDEIKEGHLFDGQEEMIDNAKALEKKMADKVKEQMKQIDDQSK